MGWRVFLLVGRRPSQKRGRGLAEVFKSSGEVRRNFLPSPSTSKLLCSFAFEKRCGIGDGRYLAGELGQDRGAALFGVRAGAPGGFGRGGEADVRLMAIAGGSF